MKIKISEIVVVLTGRIVRFLFLIWCVGCWLPLCANQQHMSRNDTEKNGYWLLLDLYTDSCNYAMRTGQYRLAYRYAAELREVASYISLPASEIISDAYLGVSYLALDRYDSAYYYLNRGKELWDGLPDESKDSKTSQAVMTILKGLGIYTTTIEMNLEKATSFFLEGLRMAEMQQDDFNYAILGANLAVLCDMRKDTTGIRYGREIYEYGLKTQNEYILYTGSMVMAIMHHLQGNYVEAQKYIENAIRYSEKNSDKMDCYRVYAEILNSAGDYTGAEVYYRKAQNCLDEKAITSALTFYYSYSKFLFARQRYDQAMNWIDKGLQLTESSNNRLHTYKLYQLKSEIFEQTGHYKAALDYQKKYQQEATDIFNVEKERSVNELTRRYEQERYERKLQEHRLVIVEKRKELQQVLFIMLLVVMGMVISVMLYRHKNKMYLQIARQYKESIRKETFLQQQILDLQQSLLKTDQKEAKEEIVSGNGSEKNDELFSRLEELMNRDKIYREKNLTRERVADVMGSNRTYLSQVINEKTGQSFLNYINTFRINEALLILSDVDNTMPLKAISQEIGFSSITTFYKLFHEKVGMTPAKYRESILRISKSDKL